MLWRSLMPTCVVLLATVGSAALAELPAEAVRLSMRVNLAAAQCATMPELRRFRQCQEGFTLTISGLRLDDARGKPLENCTARDNAPPPPLQQRILERVMPDHLLRNNYWNRYGACIGLSQQRYYRKITQNAARLRVPSEFSTDRPVLVDQNQVLGKFAELNPGLPSGTVQLHCASVNNLPAPVLMHARVCYAANGAYAPCVGPGLTPLCPARFVIFGRP